jgi:hypothetical protein
MTICREFTRSRSDTERATGRRGTHHMLGAGTKGEHLFHSVPSGGFNDS